MNAGRKRAFDREEVLEAAMAVFWKKGYGNTKLSDLTEAMGINKPSLYNTFGNKEALFIEALKHYEETVVVPTYALLGNGTDSVRQQLSDFLYKSVYNFSQIYTNYGCMLVNSVSELRSMDIPEKAAEVIASIVSENRVIVEGFFATECERVSIKGSSSNTQTLYLLAMLSGLAVMIRGGSVDDTGELIEMILDTICMS